MSKKLGIVSSFGFAIEGIKEAFKNEPNFRIHTFISFVVVAVAYFLKFETLEWVVLFLTISFVIVSELINTVLEKVVDIASPKISPKAKVAKDVSAAAVLISAALAVVIAVMLFLPKILAFFY